MCVARSRFRASGVRCAFCSSVNIPSVGVFSYPGNSPRPSFCALSCGRRAWYGQRSPVPHACARRVWEPPRACTGRRSPQQQRATRVPRSQSNRAHTWRWTRAGNQRKQLVLRALESLWIASFKGVAQSPIVAAVAEFGNRFLRRVSDAIERSLYPDVETELVVDYGVTEPSPTDKFYVDPLRDWEVSSITYYRDSRGRRIYPQLQTDGLKTRVFASDFRELPEDETDCFRAQPQAHPSIDRDVLNDNQPNFPAVSDSDEREQPSPLPPSSRFPQR